MCLHLAFGCQGESDVYSPAAATALISTTVRIASNRPYPRITTPFTASYSLCQECASVRLMEVRESTWRVAWVQAPVLYGVDRTGSN